MRANQPPTRIRIATWNLARAKPRTSARLSAIHDHMAQVNADVWVLTETWQAIAPSADHKLIAHSQAAPDRESSDGEVWTTIWSSWEAESIPLTAEPERTAAACIATPDNQKLICYGTVLPWLSDQRQFPITGAAAFQASLAAQSSEWAALRSRFPDAGLLIAGDFNQDLAQKHYYGSLAGKAALQEALAAHSLSCLTAGRNDPLLDRPGNRANIDHICASHEYSCIAQGAWPAGELPRSLSDHYGVWVELVLGTSTSL